MAAVTLEKISKNYDQFSIIKDLNLNIKDGEFVVLVGASGCGKSTTLRMIAGLETTSAGSIQIGARDVTDFGPGERNCAMVFQNYALYPHMTVAQNIGFGLKLRGKSKTEIDYAIQKAALALGLQDLLSRKPKALSGGQRQRVAIGRAIVREPDVFLFDEPLSNLDAKLRIEMRSEIKALHRRMGSTIVYVTHDQIEAMTMGHRVAVLKDGELQQHDTPNALYHRPANIFVAGFIGSPGMNLVSCVVADSAVKISGQVVRLLGEPMVGVVDGHERLSIGFRPEGVVIGDGPLKGRIRVVEDLGSEVFVHVTVEHESSSVSLVVKAAAPFGGRSGENVSMQLTGTVHVFDVAGARLYSGPAILGDS